jgi:dihydroceramidase
MKIVYLGVKGILNTKRNGNDSVIVLGYALLAFVGVGSATYHTNIKYWAQIGTFSITLGEKSRFLLGNVLFCFVISASIVHGYLNHTDMFQLLFAAMVVAVFCQCVWLVLTRVEHPHVAREMRWLGIYGAGD